MPEDKSLLDKAIPDRTDHERLAYSTVSELPFMPVSTAHMTWNETGTWRYMKPVYRNLVSPCVVGCPNGEDVEAWIRLVGEGKYAEALAKNLQESPIPGVCGRACFHPCEKRCNRKDFDRAVGINAIERFLADHGGDYVPEVRPATGKRVAVIGAGPAGLAAAYHLRRMGHAVTVYDALPEPGGVLRYGIPDYRVPREVLALEVDRLRKMGVEFRCGVRVGETLPWDAPELSGADRIFLATGVHASRPLGIEGEDAEGVMSGLEMLKRVAMGETPDLGQRVLVIGGGNTAIDAARVALRFGAKVTILYRRSREEMPAHDEEVAAAEAEGVLFQMLAAPVKVHLEGGRVKALECVKMRLGEPDESGRRRPLPIEGSNFTVPCDSVVKAVGELADFGFLPEGVEVKGGVVVVDEGLRTTNPKFYAGGDIVDQPHTIVDALAAGKRAAIAMDCELRGVSFAEILPEILWAGGPALSMEKYLRIRDGVREEPPVREVNEICRYDSLNMDYFESMERTRRPVVGLSERMQLVQEGPNRFKEVECGLSEEQVKRETDRCFHCGRCIECDNCYIFCPDVAIQKRKGKFGYDVDGYYCKGCGVCVHECPRNAMEMVRE